jgi:RimJ/RimL family protein N-acetyltransferase
MEIRLETERLIIRAYTLDDFDNLYAILSDAETMAHYPSTYDEKGTQSWLNWCIETDNAYGHSLWAMELKETGEYIGDCGVTIQNIDGEMLPEIGYHINKRFWRRGYAKEAAAAVRDWFFTESDYDSVYSYMKYTNVASYSTAASIGMKKIKEYPDPHDEICCVYRMTREEWKALKGY